MFVGRGCSVAQKVGVLGYNLRVPAGTLRRGAVNKRPTSRIVNGAISAFIVCFFIAHGFLGSLGPMLSLSSSMAWVVWVGMVIVAVHVVASIVTSYQQMTDKQFPPSPRKKRHLVFKWVTGILLASAVAVHVACMRVAGLVLAAPFLPKTATVVLSGVLAWHICVGMKSLLTDVGLDKKLVNPLRVVVCVLAAAFALATVI